MERREIRESIIKFGAFQMGRIFAFGNDILLLQIKKFKKRGFL